MKVLVTGGAGYIGSNLVRLLEKPVVLDLKKIQGNKEVSLVSYVQGDIGRLGYPDSPLKNEELEGVVHLAAVTGKLECYANTLKAYDTNVAGTQRVLEFCRRRDIKHVVFASTCGIYCDTGSYYIETKKQGEAMCNHYAEKYGINTVSLRFANVYGGAFGYKEKLTVVHRFVLKALLGEPLQVEGDGSQTRDFIHVHDVCKAILMGLELKTHGIFFVGTGVETSVKRLVEIVEKTVKAMYNKKIKVEYVPMPDYRSGEGVKGVITHSPLKGWQPSYSLELGVEDLLACAGGKVCI